MRLAVVQRRPRLQNGLLPEPGRVLVVTSVQGYGNAMRNTGDLQTLAQYLMTISQFAYAALGLCVVLVRFINRRWAHAAWWAWAFFFVWAIALIPWAWIEPSVLQTLGFALAGVACAGLIGLLVLCGIGWGVTRSVAPK